MILRQSIGLRINQAAIWRQILFGGAVTLSMSQALLANETDGLAWVTNDEDVSDYGSLTIKDTVTPANNYSGAPFDFDGGPLVFSRASLAKDLGADGLWKYTNHNLATYSEDISHAAWTKTNGAATSSDTFVPNTTLGKHALNITAGTAVISGASYTVEWEAKANGYNWIYFNTTVGGPANDIVWFDLSSGAIGTQQANVVGTISADLGDGWYRCSATFTTTGTSLYFDLTVHEGDNTTVPWSANGTDSVKFRKISFRANPCHSTEYIPTTTAAVYRPKIYRDPSTLVNYGYWPEEARTNSAIYSDDLTNAAWVKTSMTAAKTATGADGVANSATTLTATAANGYARQEITSASAQRITSTFVKRRTGTGVVTMAQGETTGSELVTNGGFATDTTGWLGLNSTIASVSGELEITADGTGQARATQTFTTVVGKVYKAEATMRRGTSTINCDILISGIAQSSAVTGTTNTTVSVCFVATATSTTIRPGTTGVTTAGQTAYVDNVTVKEVVETTLTVTSDWTRVNTAAATITNPSLIIKLATSGDVIDVMYVQSEVGGKMSSPIPTLGSAVTRAADSEVISSSLFNLSATALTLYTRGIVFSTDVDTTLASLNNSTPNERVVHLITSAALNRLYSTTATAPGTGATANTANAVTAGVEFKAAVAMAANDGASVLNGGAVATDATTTMPTMTQLNGAREGHVAMTGLVVVTERMYLPRRMSNAELQALTA